MPPRKRSTKRCAISDRTLPSSTSSSGATRACIASVVLAALDPAMRIVVLTGFASISTAVEAIKLGACHYLAKPSNADDIEAAFARADGDAAVPLGTRPTSLKTLEWERIHEMLAETDFNVSETARRLGLHRRTLAASWPSDGSPDRAVLSLELGLALADEQDEDEHAEAEEGDGPAKSRPATLMAITSRARHWRGRAASRRCGRVRRGPARARLRRSRRRSGSRAAASAAAPRPAS